LRSLHPFLSLREAPVMDDDPASAKDLFCKTKLCKFYAVGRCKQGRRCSFAHGNKNIAPMPDFYHTRMCPSFVDTGFCKNGDSCSYAHDQRDLRTGVTKATSNGANLAYLPTSAKMRDGVSQPRARANLQQLLVSYGVPQAPEKLTTSSSMPQQPFIMAEPEAEPYISGGASSTSTSRERHVFQSENRTLAPTNEKLAQAHSESAITNELNLLMQMQMISHRHWKDEDQNAFDWGCNSAQFRSTIAECSDATTSSQHPTGDDGSSRLYWAHATTGSGLGKG